jgi:hypothetical protein
MHGDSYLGCYGQSATYCNRYECYLLHRRIGYAYRKRSFNLYLEPGHRLELNHRKQRNC